MSLPTYPDDHYTRHVAHLLNSALIWHAPNLALLLLNIFFFKCHRVHRDLHSFPTRRSSDLTQAQTAGQYFTNDQIKEMTRKVSAEVDLVHQQTQNQRYGSSHIGATAKDISNVVTDAASGVVDIRNILCSSAN